MLEKEGPMEEISPLDILAKTFNRRLHGCDPDQVQEFLTRIANRVEGLLRERGELRQQVHRLEQELVIFRERDAALQQALVAAQESAKSTVEAARREGQKLVEEAQVLGDRLLEETHQRTHALEAVISDLRGQRRQARGELMRLVELIQGLVSDDQRAEKEEPAAGQLALLHRPRRGSGEA
jgi:DivIVA domain-containing protein